MRSAHSRRRRAWVIMTTIAAASVLLSGCGASKSPPPEQTTVSRPASDPPAAAAPAVADGRDPAAASAPGELETAAAGQAVAGGNGGSGNPAGAEPPPAGSGVADDVPLVAESEADEFLLVADFASLPEWVQRWHDANREFAGAFQVSADGQSYLLISAGAMPTGGYSLSVRSLTATESGWRLEVELHQPSPHAMVTQVVTYPSLFFTAPAGDIEVILHDGFQSRVLPLNEGGATH